MSCHKQQLIHFLPVSFSHSFFYINIDKNFFIRVPLYVSLIIHLLAMPRLLLYYKLISLILTGREIVISSCAANSNLHLLSNFLYKLTLFEMDEMYIDFLLL